MNRLLRFGLKQFLLFFAIQSAFASNSFEFPWLVNPAPEPYFDYNNNVSHPEIDSYVTRLIWGYTEGAFDYLNEMNRSSFTVSKGSRSLRFFPLLKSEKAKEIFNNYNQIDPSLSPEKLHDEYKKFYFQFKAFFDYPLFREINLVSDYSNNTEALWRGVANCEYFKEDVFIDEAFVSTSRDKEVALRFSKDKGCLLKFTRAGWGFNVASFSASVHEQEVLLRPHQAYKVTSRYPLKGLESVSVLEVEALGTESELGQSDEDKIAQKLFRERSHSKLIEYLKLHNEQEDALYAKELEFLTNKSFLTEKVMDLLLVE